MATYFDDLNNTPEAVIRLTHMQTGKQFKSYISQNFTISGSATYSSPFEAYLQQKSDTLNQVSAAVNTAGFNLPQQKLSIRGNTVLMWQSSDRPSFQITMLFLTVNSGNKTMQLASELASMVFPRTKGQSMTDFLEAPGGFKVGESGKAEGTWMLELGTWFRAADLVLVSTAMDIAKERTNTGQPVYVAVDCNLQPYTNVSENEFKNYFLG